MKFTRTLLEGVWLIELDPRGDERGSFVRTYCEQEFTAQGLNTRWAQCNSTRTRRRGSLRGLHYQADPFPEIKLIRCTTGRVLDVVVDLRRDSATFGNHLAVELSPDLSNQLYVPGGFAHGFQCLEEECTLFYQMSEIYHPDLARGVRWDDPTLGIAWPLEITEISDRDRGLPCLLDA